MYQSIAGSKMDFLGHSSWNNIFQPFGGSATGFKKS